MKRNDRGEPGNAVRLDANPCGTLRRKLPE
jgi:hypothetical protein